MVVNIGIKIEIIRVIVEEDLIEAESITIEGEEVILS